MKRLFLILSIAAFTLSACAPTQGLRLGTDGKPLPQVHRIAARDVDRIQLRALDSINALRQAAGAGAVQMNARLNAAAETHSRDMSRQGRPWHFGSDGSSPLDRVARSGYVGNMLGENISETFESELETLAAWMEQPDTRNVILDRRATNLGFGWYQEPSGKIWWTMLMGS